MSRSPSKSLFILVLILLAVLVGWMKFSMYRGIIGRALDDPRPEQEEVPAYETEEEYEQ